jgi:putative membrane protein
MFGHDMAFGRLFMWSFWLILLVLVIVMIRTISSGSCAGCGSQRSTDETPLDILRNRYVRGEIDEEEFKRKREEMEK